MYSGGIKPDMEREITDHCDQCTSCHRFLREEQSITGDMRGLDYTKYRQASIDAFGRLALVVRTYREPYPGWFKTIQVRPLRFATVAAMFLVFLVLLSNLNFSYSQTTGANLKITFDPPLSRAYYIKNDQFISKLNNDLNQAFKTSKKQSQVSWALEVDQDSLKGISIDIETDNSSQIADIFDSLVSKHPTFIRGEISLSPLKKEIRTSAFNILVDKKPNLIDEYEIRTVVDKDLPQILERIEEQGKILSSDGQYLTSVIEQKLPAIRELIASTSGLDEYLPSEAIVIQENGGTQPAVQAEQIEKLRNEIILMIKGSDPRINDYDLERLLNLNFDGSKSRIIIGGQDNLFSPSMSGGKVITLIRDPKRHADLNGLSDIISSNDIDDLLKGKTKASDLEKLINTRLNGKHKNEMIIIEVWQGEKKAEITVQDSIPKVVVISPSIPSNFKVKPSEKQLSDDYKESDEYTEFIKNIDDSKRELVLKQFDSYKEEKNEPEPSPSYSNNYQFLPGWLKENEIKSLVDGSLSSNDLEKIIEERIAGRDDAVFKESSMVMIKNGKTITISIYKGKVSVKVKDSELSNRMKGLNAHSGSGVTDSSNRSGGGISRTL